MGRLGSGSVRIRGEGAVGANVGIAMSCVAVRTAGLYFLLNSGEIGSKGCWPLSVRSGGVVCIGGWRGLSGKSVGGSGGCMNVDN